MKQVAQMAGVSESLVSQIERNKVSPSIDTLFSLANVLNVNLDFLLSDLKKNQAVELVRKEDRKMMSSVNVVYHQLSRLLDDDLHGIEAFLIELEPQASTGSRDAGHIGKELGYILKGLATLECGDEKFSLKAGDSISFSSKIPHRLINVGSATLEALWVITPPKMNFFQDEY